jgi:hypothetical protein
MLQPAKKGQKSATYIGCGAFSTVWAIGDRALKITQDTTTIDFYESIAPTKNKRGLPDVSRMSYKEMAGLYFDYQAMRDPESLNTGNLDDEIRKSCLHTGVFSFLNDPALLQNFKGYTMPKYKPLPTTMAYSLQKWRWYAEDNNLELYCSTDKELDRVIHLFKKMIPAEYYYPESLDYIVRYLKERDYWALDPSHDNFLLDQNGKIVFTDIFSGGETRSIKLKDAIQQNADIASSQLPIPLKRAK